MKHRDRRESPGIARFVAAAWCLFALTAAADDLPGRSALKPDEFLKTWVVLKPITISGKDQTPSEEVLKQAFAEDWLIGQSGETGIRPRPGLKQRIVHKGLVDQPLEWQSVRSKDDDIDLQTDTAPVQYSIAYAWVEFNMPAATQGLLGIGSDDAVKVWLNGKLIHDKWAVRPVTPDEDVVPAEFKRGSNRILLKVLNGQGGWGFAFRLMGEKAQAEKLSQAANAADIDALKRNLALGMNINARGSLGLTAVQSARLLGQVEAVSFLASQGANLAAELPQPEQMADKLMALKIRSDGAGAAVLIAQNGKILLEKGYGLSDVEHRVPVTPQTPFRIGSITKQFTAAAILKLQEQGKLTVQDKLSKYIADFPRGDEVTLHHLLTHTSGIHSYTSKPNFAEQAIRAVKTDELIQSIKNDPYDFDPGTKWLYSNSGYFLLGYIVEKVSGQAYGDFLRTQFFEPLGMTSTGVHRAGVKLPNEALGYEYSGGDPARAADWDMTWAGGAGVLYSTVGDLYRWNEAVFGGKVLTQISLQTAFTAAKTTDGLNTGYGYGWGLSTLRGSQIIAHGGGLPGFSSYILRMPRERFTVVVLENALPPPQGASADRLATSFIPLYLGDKLETRQPISAQAVSIKALDALVGRYDLAGQAIMTVTRDGNRLFTQMGNQPPVEVLPRSETEFAWKAVDADLVFVKDESGKAVKAIRRQGGREVSADRMENIVEAQVDPTELDALVGKYDYGNGAILTVTREGAHLFAQLTKQPKFEIFPKSATEFFWKVVNAQVTFIKDGQGKVTKGIHRQGGHIIEAAKLE
jgi:CubicO group peptidase (beta-lactamase class C family)